MHPKCMVLSPPKVRSWLGFAFSIYSVFQTTFLPVFPLLRKRKKLSFWNKQFLYRDSQSSTHTKLNNLSFYGTLVAEASAEVIGRAEEGSVEGKCLHPS